MVNGFQLNQLREIQSAVEYVCHCDLRSKTKSKYAVIPRKAFYLMSLQLTSCTNEQISWSIGFYRHGVYRAAREGTNQAITNVMVKAGFILFKDVDFCDLPKQAIMPWHIKAKEKA